MIIVSVMKRVASQQAGLKVPVRRAVSMLQHGPALPPRPAVARSLPADGGVTLIELLVVMAILALGAMLALPAFRNAGGSEGLRPTVGKIAAELKLARSSAILHQRPVAFVLDAKSRSYRVPDFGAPVRLPASIGVVLAPDRNPGRIGGGDRLVFFPDGSSSGGQVLISQQGATLTLDVAWLTGAVTLQGSAP